MATQTPITIKSWSEVQQKLFYGDKEIVNDSKKVQPGAKAQPLQYTTREGVLKTFYFADEVTLLDTEGLRLKRQAINDLHKRFMRHEISAEDYATGVIQLA